MWTLIIVLVSALVILFFTIRSVIKSMENGIPYFVNKRNKETECDNHFEVTKVCVYCFGCDILEFDGSQWTRKKENSK